MLAVRLMGGLGNQLFQYAFGRQMARRLGIALQLDLRWYDEFGPGSAPRKYELGCYPIRASIASPESLPYLPKSRAGRALARLARRFSRWFGGMGVYAYFPPGWNPAAAVPRDNTLYIGYWQSERYFLDIAEDLRSEFTPTTPPSGSNADLTAALGDCTGVSLHVRRGDYVSNQETNKIHGVPSLDYYREAMALIRERVAEPRFFVFSDDIDWCRANLPFDATAVFVQGNGGDRAFEDLRLMSLCRHHVIANSSFSWWGAWLNPHPEKVVVAPSRWIADPTIDTTDLIPPTWIRLQLPQATKQLVGYV